MTAVWIRQADLLPFATLRALIVPRGVSGTEATDLARRALHDYACTRAGSAHHTWQDGWDALTGASQQRPGTLRVDQPRCRECNGRRYSTSSRNISRNLSRGRSGLVCLECSGTGRGPRITMTAYPAPRPDQASTDGQEPTPPADARQTGRGE